MSVLGFLATTVDVLSLAITIVDVRLFHGNKRPILNR